jgi:hypothetical protein
VPSRHGPCLACFHPAVTRARLKLTWIATALGAAVVYAVTGNPAVPGAVLFVWGWVVASDYHGVARRLHSHKRLFFLRREVQTLELKLLFAGLGVVGAVMLFLGVQSQTLT